jgi:hypothetical protein
LIEEAKGKEEGELIRAAEKKSAELEERFRDVLALGA